MDVDSQAPIVPGADLIRAEDLWFEDCGLIIQAEKTIFRVSRDHLAVHSPVFKDMLSLPTPKESDMMLGCPFVALPDSAEDIMVFLKALLYYDFFEPYPAPVSYAVLSSVLRMSHKYDLPALRKRALIHLSSQFPTKLDDYESLLLQDPPEWYKELVDVDGCGFHSLTVLACSLSIRWILPLAFYRVCEFSSEGQILRSAHTLDDKIYLFTACRTLEGTSTTNILEFLWHAVLCVSPETCSAGVQQLAARRMKEKSRIRPTTRAPYMPLDIWKLDDWNTLQVCAACLASMKAEHRVAKQAHWDSLPEMFGLPEWSELEKMKAEALS
ncbi:BTB domain-containing protein [Favolaschia claudopus]|uniref:BTB domain-containing protein n=1 Tax=Favolaschia claudopus TaxID=2862362 RepID=A0AAW0BNY3_9AGAR